MNRVVFFVALACFFATVLSQTVVYTPDSASTIFVGRSFSIKLRFSSFAAADDNTIITVTPNSNSAYTVVPSGILYNTTTDLYVDKIFNVTLLVSGPTSVIFGFSSSTPYTPNSQSITPLKRAIQYTTSVPNTYVGVPSSSIGVYIPNFVTPDTGNVIVTLQSDPAVATFTPASLTFNAQTNSNSQQQFYFYYTISNFIGPVTVYATFSNAEYFQSPNTSVNSQLRPPPSIPTFLGTAYTNQVSDAAITELYYAPITTVSYRPTAANTTFTPAVLTYTPSVTTVSYTYITSYPGSYPITFTTEGTDSVYYANYTAARSAVGSKASTSLTSPSTTTLFMTQVSGSFTFTLSTPAVNGLTVTPVLVQGANQYVTVTPSTLTFVAGDTTKTFTLSSNYPTSVTGISFTLSGSDSAFFSAPSVSGFSYSWKTVTLSTDAGTSAAYCGDTQTYTIGTDFPTVNGFSVAISPAGGAPVVINPSSVTFNQGDTEHTFTVTGTGANSNNPSISFAVTGQDAIYLTNNLATTALEFDNKRVSITRVYPSSGSIYPGTVVQIAVTVDQLPSTSLTVTPSAPSGVTFSSAVTFTPSTSKTLYVTAVAQVVASYTITWSISGADSICYQSTPSVSSLNVAAITTTSSADSTVQYGTALPVTVTVPHLNSDLIATVYAVDATDGSSYPAVFSQSTLTFSQATSTATFTATFPQYSANSINILFTLSGSAASYVTILPITVALNKITIKVPVFGTETFYFNTQSPALSVALPVPTANGLTLRLHANLATLSTTSLTYSASVSVASFSFSNLVASTSTNTDTITYTLEGADADLYVVSAASTTVRFSLIPINNNLASTQVSLTVNKPFTFVLSTPVAPAGTLTILPQGPFTFSPATITLTAAAPSIQVTATATSTYNAQLSFVVTGTEAPFYAAISSVQATIVKGIITVTPPTATTVPTFGSSQPFILSSNIIPSNGVTVTMYSPLATFNPPSFTLDAQHLSKSFTFTVNPSVLASTTTAVTISYFLSGTDAVNFSPIVDSSASLSTYAYQYSFSSSTSSISLNYGQASTFTITATGVSNSVTFTPTSQNGNLAFSPASATFTPGSLTAIFSVSATGYYAGDSSSGYTSFIDFVLGGTDAALFSQPVSTISVAFAKVAISAPVPSSAIIGGSTVGTITLAYPPATDLTITLSSPQSDVTIQPSVFTLTPTSSTTLTYTVTSSIVHTAQNPATILFTTSGTSVADFASITAVSVLFNIGQIATNGASTTTTWQGPGHTRIVRFTLNTPVITALTITPVASSLIFDPATITVSSGSTYAETNATAEFVLASGSISYVLGGADAPRFSAAAAAYSVAQLKLVSTVVDNLYADQLITTTLQTSASVGSAPNFPFSPILVVPAAPGFTFTPASAVFSQQQHAATFIATASNILPGTTLLYSVNDSTVILPSSLSASLVAVPIITPSFTLSTAAAVTIGSSVQGFFSLLVNGRSPLLTTVPSVTVTFSSNLAGVFSPSSVTLENGATNVPVLFTPTQLSTVAVYVYYSISGPGSSFFTTEGYASFPSVTKRTITVSPPIQLNLLNSITTYGRETDTFYVAGTSQATSTFQATLTPISDYFDFKPSSINFANATSTTFTIIPKKLGHGLSIQFFISGPDADLFTVPVALPGFSVVPMVNISSIPALTANQKSEAITVTLTPTPLETVVVTPICYKEGITATCIFNPSTLTFSPTNGTSSFTVTALSSNIFNPSASNIVVPGTTTTLAGSSGGFLRFTASDSVSTYSLPITAYSLNTNLPVAPSTFSITHPRYQMGVTSHITISVSNLPVSDIAVTLYGTNMEFNPSYVIFTANGPTSQKVKVTPKSSSSYELDYDSSKIEYGCSGYDRANYICPTESQHFVAIQRGYVAAVVLLPIFGVVIALLLFFLVIRPRSRANVNNNKGKSSYEIKE